MLKSSYRVIERITVGHAHVELVKRAANIDSPDQLTEHLLELIEEAALNVVGLTNRLKREIEANRRVADHAMVYATSTEYIPLPEGTSYDLAATAKQIKDAKDRLLELLQMLDMHVTK